MGFAYAVRTDDPAVQLPCRYAFECDRPRTPQFTSGLWRQRPDSLGGRRLVLLWIDHLQEPHSDPGHGLSSTLEFYSQDSTVFLDVSSVRIVHRTPSGDIVRPERVLVDSAVGCTSCEHRSVTIRVRNVYGRQRIPRRLREEISADLLVKGTRVPVRVVFKDVRHRLWWTFWDVMMSA